MEWETVFFSRNFEPLNQYSSASQIEPHYLDIYVVFIQQLPWNYFW